MRIEFKKQRIKKGKFFKFCEDNGADFFETDDEYGVWIIPKKYGDYLMGIGLYENGWINFVLIDEDCMNIEVMQSKDGLHIEEQNWVIQTLTLFKKYKPLKTSEK